ncbi:AAA family ATPase [Lactobacillus sp. S2-2]|uniref:replication-associated recombination protein A n=1 Tax=Lactobacillus sp. S2-2 TaxID=2692917 RepID=UPI001F2B5378|nr:replication-associated recombination protein A [Lactobacillus sp. S2-2]MCF6515782.1 AAA family ATPase [Lactobacillus sp. S2-2]
MNKPLAFRMRPKTIKDVVGQNHLINDNKIINRMVKAKMLSSMILYGPPGTGKTSIASAIAGSTKYAFRILNAATDTKKDLQIIANEAKMSGIVVLLLDEIHRLDKTKQDFLLPLMESGQIILIGATTENPYININPAIRSRVEIFQVFPLNSDDIKKALQRALNDKENGLGNYNVNIDSEAIDFISTATNGDLRSSLNALELAVKSTEKDKKNIININVHIVEECLQKKSIRSDKNGDEHYNVISALQKSIRGSDTDAALHYAARLIEAGDLKSLIRRLIVISYEDIGLANPNLSERVVQACNAAEKLGLPEGRIPLSTIIIEMCVSPKSNSSISAIDKAISDVKSGNFDEIPNYLKDSHYQGSEKLGVTGYLFPHDYKNDWVAQQYLPNNLNKTHYYYPKNNGKIETAFGERYLNLKEAQRRNQNGN